MPDLNFWGCVVGVIVLGALVVYLAFLIKRRADDRRIARINHHLKHNLKSVPIQGPPASHLHPSED
jgi:hypothetical protein